MGIESAGVTGWVTGWVTGRAFGGHGVFMTTMNDKAIATNGGDAPAGLRVAGVNVSPPVVGMVLALGAVFAWLFYRWFLKQHQHSWNKPEDWAHAYVIPLISVYLIWRSREAIARTAARVFWPGLLPLMLGVLCYFFALINIKNHMIQGFSLILTLFGLCLLMLGPKMMRYLFVPTGYLVFAVTISESIMIAITFKLQLIASKGSWVMLNMIGKPFGWFTAEVDGNTLMIITSAGAEIPMNVAEACSGMRMVVAFFALAVAVALIACRDWWQRILLIALAAPVAILMNIVRVTVLGLFSLADPELATGDAHTIIGTLLLFPSLLLFLGVVWVLNRIVKEPDATARGASA